MEPKCSNLNLCLACSFFLFVRIRLDKFQIVELFGASLVMSNSNPSSFWLCWWLQIACYINFNNPIVLSHASNWRKLLIKETLLTQEKQPQLNIDKNSTPLYLFNT